MENKKFFYPAFVKLLITQTQVAFNDNATKLVLIGLVNLALPQDEALRYVSVISLLLVSPFVLFAPMAGWLNDRFARRDVIRWSLWLQMAVMVFLIVAVLAGSLPLVMAGFFLLAVQSTFFSPAKRSILKELQPPERLQAAVGWAEMLCIGAILGGSLAGGFAVDALAAATKDPTLAAAVSLGIFFALCVGTAVIFRAMPRGEGNPAAGFSWRALFGHGELLRTLKVTPGVLRPVAAESTFYFVGGVLMIVLAQMARIAHPAGPGAGQATGVLMALLGAGIGVGSLAAATLRNRESRVGVIPLAALGMAIGLLTLAASGGGLSNWAILIGIGACGGLFCVPVSSALIERAPVGQQGSVLAASSLCSSVTGIAAVGVQWLLSQEFGWSPGAQLVFLAVVMVATAVMAMRWLKVEFLTMVARGLGHAFYRVKPIGAENLPKTGGALLVCNHVSYVDAIILSLASERPIRFLSFAGFFDQPVLGGLLRAFGAIPVSGAHSKDAIRSAAARVRDGELVCIFPEGQLTRTGSLMELRRGYELIARQADCAVIPVVTDGLWRSIFSFERGRYFFKVPNSLRIAVRVVFGPALTDTRPEELRRVMGELGADAFSARPELNRSLDVELVRALRRNPFRVAIADYGLGGRKVRAGVLLGLGGAVAKRWRTDLAGDDRVGVILPPGIGGTVANLALIFAGKTPVNLNPTAGTAAMEHCLATARINCVVSAEAVREKFPDLPWPPRFFDIGLVLGKVRKRELFVGMISPFKSGGSKRKPSEFILFTSGSSGKPKGVRLTSRHLLANSMQIDELGLLRRNEVILSGLPLFHCFGLNVGMSSALLTGRRMVTVPTPFDYGKIAKAAKGEKATFLLTTPTFLKGYLRKIPAEAFVTMRCICCGAEKLPSCVADATREKFGAEAIEGYGLTETSPVVAFNQPNPDMGIGADSEQLGQSAGAVGRLVPGLAWRRDEAGVLSLRGANVVTEYLGCESNGEWFETGDVVSFDADGFLRIEGRTSRFSKIGGEMVPHAAVENALAEAFVDDLAGADCVIGVEVSEGEEELALVTTRELDRESLRTALRDQGLPNLWIPKRVLRVEALPALASGKVDLGVCRELAAAAR